MAEFLLLTVLASVPGLCAFFCPDIEDQTNGVPDIEDQTNGV